MSRADNLLIRINALNVKDVFVRDVLSAIGETMGETDREIVQTAADNFFDTCSEKKLAEYEKETGITPLASQSIEDRRSSLSAKWKSDGKVDVALLQAVANSWRYGGVNVDFVENQIQITFTDTLGMPSDTAGLQLALDEVKPAHLPIVFLATYLYIREISVMTVAELQEQPIAGFAFERR